MTCTAYTRTGPDHTPALGGVLTDQSGTITVDWVVLTAATVGLCMALVTAASAGTGALGAHAYFVDFVGRPVARLDLQQSVNIANGAPAQVSFMLGAHVARSGMEAYWGNAYIATFDGSNTPFQHVATFTYDVQGSAGDGSNALRFKATDGDGWLGFMAANVELR